MNDQEEHRLNRLLLSVEREEREVQRPTGAFGRQLIFDSESEEEPLNNDEEDDDGYGIVLRLSQENDEVTSDDEAISEHEAGENVFFFDDSNDIEQIPLLERLKNSIVKRRNGKQAYLGKDKSTLWDLIPHERQTLFRDRNVLRIRMGYVVNAYKTAKNPLDVWKIFFTDDMIIQIVEDTNIYIEKMKENYTRERNCKPTTPAEIKAVIGILYMSGAIKTSHTNLEDLWTRNGLGVEFFPLVMSLFRFKFLLRAMRFDNMHTRNERKILDRLAPIRDFFEQFVENCQKPYVVSEFVTVDEMLEAFRGRCAFRQFIKSKPARYGVKIFALSCARSFYTLNLEIYAGKQPEGPFRVDNSGKSVVERMVQPISQSGRNVTVDNWFSSIPLCIELLQNHRLTMVGTLKKNKKEIPPTFIDTKARPIGSSIFGFKEGITMVSYNAKKNKQVVLISSMHDDDATDTMINSPTYGKPEIILFYNSSKGGVDNVDSYKQHYSVARIANRWTMTVFYSLLNIGGLNSFIVLKQNVGDVNMKRRKFLQELARGLCQELMLSRINIKSTPSWTKRRLRELLDVPQQERPHPPEEDVTSGRCYACHWKKNRPSKTRCSRCKFFICKEHSSPAVCVNCGKENSDMEISDSDCE